MVKNMLSSSSFWIPFLFGFLVTQLLISLYKYHNITSKVENSDYRTFNDTYAQCIETLPRDKDCVFELTPKIVDKE